MEKTKLINCSDCEKEISKNAKTCPHCGAKNKKRIGFFGWLFLTILGFFIIGTLATPPMTTGTPAASLPQSTELEPEELLEVMDWSCSSSGSNSYVITEGRVKNISSMPLRNIEVVAELFTKDGTFITSDSSLIEYDPIMPGQISPFKSMSRNNPLVGKCTVSFKRFGGGTIPTKTK